MKNSPALFADRPIYGGIDIGSNAVRLSIGVFEKGQLHLLEKVRLPIRLGSEAFNEQNDQGLSEATIRIAMHAFWLFKEMLEQRGVNHIRAVATSALRDAPNAQKLIRQVKKECGLDIEVISGKEEAALVYKSFLYIFRAKSSTQVLLDLGGGSAEFIITKKEKFIDSKSFRIGTVRLLNKMKKGKLTEEGLLDYLEENYSEKIKKFLQSNFKSAETIDLVCSGGNFRRIGKLRSKMFNEENSEFVTKQEVDKIHQRLLKTSLDERIHKYGLRKDRAEVIIPALSVLKLTRKILKVDCAHLPKYGLIEGVLYSMYEDHE